MKAAQPEDNNLRIASDKALDRLTHLAARLLNVPVALIDSVDDEHQWSRSNGGELPPAVLRETKFYAHLILQSDVFVVDDAFGDIRFVDKPLIISGSPIRFCAGAPLLAPDGFLLGTFCVMDFVAREMNADGRETLWAISQQALAHLEARRNIAELEQSTSRHEQAKTDLRASEERFFKAFDASPEPMAITKYEDGKYLYVNKSFARRSNYSEAEIIGRSTLELNLWANPEDSDRLIRKLDEQGSIYKEEISILTKSGEIRAGLFSAEIIEVDGDRCIISLTHDITERKQVEDALRESESKYRSLIESLPAVVYLAEPEPPYSPIYVSPSIEALGFPLNEWFTRPDLWVSMLHPDDRERVLKDTEAAMAARRENDYEYRVVGRGGAEHWVHDRGRFVLDDNGKPFCWQGVIIDITERKLAESRLAVMHKRLEESHDNLLSLLNQLQFGVVMVDEDGRVTFVSEVCREIFGNSLESVIGEPWERACPFNEINNGELNAMLKLAPEERNKIPVQIDSSNNIFRWLEVDVQDDPRDSRRKIFFLYDVSDVYDLRRLLDEKVQFQDLVGKSSSMQHVYQQVREIASLNASVLIRGETGTGKELVARAIHFSSDRREKPFVAVNCASLSESLLSSQLFGHKRGAFTGAVADHIGMFEAANGGTLLLDEIGDMPVGLQTSLLRVLQENEITRLGDSKPRKIDVRIIAATQHDLRDEIAKGNFRADLLYRIQVIRIGLPPLRERREDIPLLAESFLTQYRLVADKQVRGISNEAMRVLLDYPWPGNVRELKSTIEFSVIFCKGAIIQTGDLPLELLETNGRKIPFSEHEPNEKLSLLAALEQVEGNRAAAARLLGISRATLYRRLSNLDINEF